MDTFTLVCGFITCFGGGFVTGTGLVNLRENPGMGLAFTFLGLILIGLGFFILQG